MKIAEYKQMMAYLTRPGFSGGGNVLPKKKPKEEAEKVNKARKEKNFEKVKGALENPKEVKEMIDKPKRGLVDEPGKYSQESKGPGKGNPGILRKGRASKLSAEEKKYINKRFNQTGKPFDKWWPTIGNDNRQNYMNAFDRVELSKKELAKLKKKNLISTSKLDEILTKAGKKTGKIADFINDPAYQVLKPKVVEGIYASQGQGKVRNTFFKKPNAQQIKNILALHTGKGGSQPALKNVTINAVNNLIKDKPFVNFLNKWNEGDDIPDKIIKKIFSPNAAYNPNTIARYAQILDGSIPFEGIKADKKLAEKIKKGIKFEAGGARGSWQQAARNIAIREFDKIFNPAGKSKLTFASRQNAIKNKFLDYGLKGLSVDEILAMRTGYTSGQSPYSIFSQVLTNKMNTAVKNQLDGQTSKRALRLQEAIKEYGVDSKQANKIRLEQKNYITEFRVNNPEFAKANLPEFSFKSPQEVLGEKRFFSLPKEAQTAMKKTFKEQKFTPDLGKGLKTQKELAQVFSTKEGALRYLNTLGINATDTTANAASKIKNSPLPPKIKNTLLGVLGLGGGSLVGDLFRPVQADEPGAKEATSMLPTAAAAGTGAAAVGTPTGRNILGKIFRVAGTPLSGLGFAGTNVYSKMKEGQSLADAVVDPITGLELSFPGLFKENLKKIIPERFQGRAARFGRGLLGLRGIPVGPIGLTLAGLGQAQEFYNQYQDLQRMKEQNPRAYSEFMESRQTPALSAAEQTAIEDMGRSGAAGGGIMKMAGKSSGRPPESGPTPQGLDFILKRGR
jgi:hypothetical protein